MSASPNFVPQHPISVSDIPQAGTGLFVRVTKLLFHIVPPAGVSGLFVALFDKSGNVLAFVGPFLSVVVLQEALLWLFHWAQRMGASHYEVLRKD
mgnify:CR=1 FL=1